MKINSASLQNFGMAKVSDSLHAKISEKHNKQLADNTIAIIKESGSANTLVSDFLLKGAEDIGAVRFPQKYGQAVYLINISPGEPLERNIRLAENKFFNDVALNSLRKGAISTDFFELQKDFPERRDYITDIYIKATNEMRNQEELKAIRK